MIDRAGQVWELDGGTIILVLRSYVSCFSLLHDVLILKSDMRGRFGHVEGSVSPNWREGGKAWEEPGADRWRLG